MREIKFRGKDLKTKQWVYGVPYTKEIFSTEHKKIIGYKTYIITYLADDLRSIERDEVDPNTVGQFTGLHDKNGVEIYGGDIVQECGLKETWTLSRRDEFSNRKHVIMWDEEQLEWIGNILEEYLMKIWDRRDLGFLNEKYTLEVIGNIHEEVGE